MSKHIVFLLLGVVYMSCETYSRLIRDLLETYWPLSETYCVDVFGYVRFVVFSFGLVVLVISVCLFLLVPPFVVCILPLENWRPWSLFSNCVPKCAFAG